MIVDFLITLSVFIGLVSLAVYMDYSTTERMKKYSISVFDLKRQKDNLKIVELLINYIEENPSQRFGQILKNLEVFERKMVQERGMEEWQTGNVYIDHQVVHDEPSIILERMKKALAEQE